MRRKSIFDLLGIPEPPRPPLEFFRPYEGDPLQVLCEVCRSVVKVTARGTLFRHRAVEGLPGYCKGSGPRAPRTPPKGRRPDLSFPNRESGAYLLEQLDRQDAAREAQAVASQRWPKRAMVRARAKGNTRARKRREPADCQVDEP